MFRKVSAPNWLASAVTQEVITSVSKTPSLTFLQSDPGAARATRREGTWARPAGLGGEYAILPAEQMGAPGRDGAVASLPPSQSSEHLGDQARETALVTPNVFPDSTRTHTRARTCDTLTRAHSHAHTVILYAALSLSHV